ncbi:MAG: hypothetical protein AB7P24_15425 [Nitrospira sp.]
MKNPVPENEELFFETMKEDRGWYFVEYHPPKSGFQFATLTIVVLAIDRTREDIATTMESELIIWLERYPIPIMVSALDDTGTVVDLSNHRPCNRLIGYIDARTNKVVQEWRLLANDELPRDALNTSYLREVYADIPFKTKQQLRTQALEKAKQLRLGWWLVFIWAVVVPAGVAVLEYWSDWLGLVVLGYSLYKAVEKALRLLGKWPKSKDELQKDAEETRMRHHHHHGECNPEGFERLKLENFERWARKNIQNEAQALRHSTKGDE